MKLRQASLTLLIAATVTGNAWAERTISRDEQWSGTVVLEESVTIDQATVTIEPGTAVSASEEKGIRVGRGGVLTAVGTQEAPVVLKGRVGAAIQLNGGRLSLEHCRLSGWESTTDPKNSRSITGSVATDGVRLVDCQLENCGKISLSLGGLLEVLSCDFREASGVSVHGKGEVHLIGNTLQNGSLATTRVKRSLIRDNVVINGGISAFGCAELEVTGNYVHKPTADGGIGLHFADGEIRDNVLRGGSWTAGVLTGQIDGNLFISLPKGNHDDVKAFNSQNTHEHVFGLKADAVVERNIFVGPSYGALMGIGANNMSSSVIRHNTFDMHDHGYAVYMNHLVKSKPKDVEVYNNIFMRCEGVNDESSYLDSATWIDHNLWSEAGKDKDGRFRKVRMTGKVPGGDGFGGNGIPPFGSSETLAIVDVVTNPDVVFPFTDDEMLARRHTVAAILAVYRTAYTPKTNSAAVNAGLVRGAHDAVVTDGKPDIGAIEL